MPGCLYNVAPLSQKIFLCLCVVLVIQINSLVLAACAFAGLSFSDSESGHNGYRHPRNPKAPGYERSDLRTNNTKLN